MENALMLINILYGLTQVASQFNLMITSAVGTLEAARKEGRDVTPEELEQFIRDRMASQQHLADILQERPMKEV